MKTSFLTIIFLFNTHLVHPQDTRLGTPYSLGEHGIEITLDDHWNFIQQTVDDYEFLYGCSGDEFCANIQVTFQDLDLVQSTVEKELENLFQEYKLLYPGLEFSETTKMINGLKFNIVDFHIKVDGLFLGQTVAITKINHKMALFCYSSEVQHNYKQAKEDYALERNRFLDILHSLRMVESEKLPKVGSQMFSYCCNDTTTILITQNDSLKCYINLKAKADLRDDRKLVLMNNTSFISTLYYKGVLLSNDQNDNSDMSFLTKFISEMTSAIYYYTEHHLNKNYIYTRVLRLDSSHPQNVYMWYPVFLSKKEHKKITKSKTEDLDGQFSNLVKVVFVSLIIDDFIYCIQMHLHDEKSFDEVKNLLSEMIKSLKYSYDTLEPYELCPQYL